MDLTKIFEILDISDADAIAFKNEEDGEEYAVWKVITPDKRFVLKEAKEYEFEVYEKFLSIKNDFSPKLYKTVKTDDANYLLMEYIPGDTLMKCTREKLVYAVDAIVSMQKSFWNKEEYINCGFTFEKSIENRINRGKYLYDRELEKTYSEFMKIYKSLPRTLCHDDLLPFNIISSNEKAVIIDWEVAGLLPYPVSLARFIAHAEESEDAFFYMTEEDKKFAVQYYYDKLINEKGISIEEFERIFDYFIFYEYCEWVMLGNKYGNTESERFQKYYNLAKKKSKEIEEKTHK